MNLACTRWVISQMAFAPFADDRLARRIAKRLLTVKTPITHATRTRRQANGNTHARMHARSPKETLPATGRRAKCSDTATNKWRCLHSKAAKSDVARSKTHRLRKYSSCSSCSTWYSSSHWVSSSEESPVPGILLRSSSSFPAAGAERVLPINDSDGVGPGAAGGGGAVALARQPLQKRLSRGAHKFTRGAQRKQKTPPQARQWCLRTKGGAKVRPQPAAMHRGAASSGTQLWQRVRVRPGASEGEAAAMQLSKVAWCGASSSFRACNCCISPSIFSLRAARSRKAAACPDWASFAKVCSESTMSRVRDWPHLATGTSATRSVARAHSSPTASEVQTYPFPATSTAMS
mmetsp:Transcript_36105/g.103974  ORF Transcript_36105/g.103974 Transcript_36105/m.103974 type:complete len:348 (-) Transcript_36105:149-1192(-)